MTCCEAIDTAWPGGVATYPLTRIEDAVTLGIDRRYHWFRGHSEPVDLILAGSHRKPFSTAGRDNIEFRAAQRFRNRAKILAASLPEWDDHISWLLLAQHYGVPTPLVDWTESALVGLYFATGGDENKDGELWCMDPDALNKCSSMHICQSDSPAVRYLAGVVFTEPKHLPMLLERSSVASVPSFPLSFIPAFGFPRMAAQQSRFTIHPSGNPDYSIEWLLRAEEFLVKYSIAANLKAQLRWDLRALGITAETLFASLESLAETIKLEILEQDYDITAPPRFENRRKKQKRPTNQPTPHG